jgi:hypothetical protein
MMFEATTFWTTGITSLSVAMGQTLPKTGFERCFCEDLSFLRLFSHAIGRYWHLTEYPDKTNRWEHVVPCGTSIQKVNVFSTKYRYSGKLVLRCSIQYSTVLC